MKQGQFPEIFQLSDLNGQNGFKLDGENGLDNSGYSVSKAGDINGDKYSDLIIGAWGYGHSKGRSYVVFGNSDIGVEGTVLLSSLNGTNGFKIDGENDNDLSGMSVSAAGDINGDGYADLLIGVPAGEYHIIYQPNCTGYSYVVFGGRNVGGDGVILLSTLNGISGFKLNGESNEELSGYSVSAAGDINDDGHADLLIGASNYARGTGRSYAVFGGPDVENVITIPLSTLNGIHGFKIDSEALFDGSGISVSTAGDINGDGVVDVLIGAPGHSGATGRSYVVFGTFRPGYYKTV